MSFTDAAKTLLGRKPGSDVAAAAAHACGCEGDSSVVDSGAMGNVLWRIEAGGILVLSPAEDKNGSQAEAYLGADARQELFAMRDRFCHVRIEPGIMIDSSSRYAGFLRDAPIW